jgi:cbb3-type cytochrome oxidase subunit 3
MGNGAKYLTYTATLSGTDKMINLTVSGTPKDSKVASSSSSAGIIIGVGSLGLVLILVGIWMYFRSKKQNEDDEEVVEIDGDSSEEEVIMDSIIALDDQYKNGKIEESVYKNRRTELTEKLKNLKS